MKFSVASILALATVAIAAPTNGHGGDRCEHVVCTDENSLAVELGLNIDLPGLLDLSVALGIDLGLLLGGHTRCKTVYCCPSRCEKGQKIPNTCSPWRY